MTADETVDTEITLRDHSDDVESFDEPEDGWVTADPHFTTEILSIMLCSFTARPADLVHDREDEGKLSVRVVCRARVDGFHADVDCLENYFSATSIRENLVPTDKVALMASRDSGGDVFYQGVLEPTGKSE